MEIIELEISEVDRQEANRYYDIEGCLIATALLNRGYNVWGVGLNRVFLDSYKDKYELDRIYDSTNLYHNWSATQKPFYLPSVVGLKITLTKICPNKDTTVTQSPTHIPASLTAETFKATLTRKSSTTSFDSCCPATVVPDNP